MKRVDSNHQQYLFCSRISSNMPLGGLRYRIVLLAALVLLGLAPLSFAQTDSVPQLLEALHSKNSFIRIRGITELGDLKEQRGVEPLIAILQDKNVAIRGLAAKALGGIGDARAVEPLIAVLKTAKDANTRSLIVLALSELKDPRSIDVLTTALDDSAANVKTLAVTALGNIKDRRAVEALHGALNSKDPRVQADAVRVLALMNTPQVSPVGDPVRASSKQAQDHAAPPAANCLAFTILSIKSDQLKGKKDWADGTIGGIQSKVEEMMINRGFHLAKISEPVCFKVNIELVEAADITPLKDAIRSISRLEVAAILTISQGSGQQVFRKVVSGSAEIEYSGPNIYSIPTTDYGGGLQRAINDLSRKLAKDESFSNVLYNGQP
jgi:hypothetical protein